LLLAIAKAYTAGIKGTSISSTVSVAEPSKVPRGTDLIRLTPLSNVIDRKRVLARHASAELAPLRRANACTFHGRFGALNDFGDWLAVRDRYKNVRVSRH